MKKIKLKKIIVLGLIAIPILGFTGCMSDITIPFNIFVIDNKEIENKEEILKISKIPLEKCQEDIELIENAKELSKKIELTLLDKKNYTEFIQSSNIESFYSKEIFELDYINKIKENKEENTIYKILEKIFYKEHNTIYSIHLNSIGQKIINTNIYNYALLDLNIIEDKLGFDVITIEIIFNDNNKIIGVEYLTEKIDTNNTNSEIDNDSIISNKTNKEFKKIFDDFLEKMKNKPFYEKIKNENITKDSNEFKGYSEQFLKSKDTEGLFKFFMATKGEFNNLNFVQYNHSDIGKKADSYYIIAVPYEGKIDYFKIKFNRLNLNIEDIIYVKTLSNEEYNNNLKN